MHLFHPADREREDVFVILSLPYVQGLLQNSPDLRHPMQTERNVTRGRALRGRESGTANESEGEVFLAQNALASALRAGRDREEGE